MSYGFIITVDGQKLLAKRVAGEKIEITRVMVGKGNVQEGQSPVYFTDLVEPVAQATSTSPIVKENIVSFIVEYRSDLNGGLKEGFWIKEFGIFAKDDEKEILLYYATLGDFPQYVTAYKNGALDVRRYPVSIAISDGVKVTLNYPANAFVTEESFWELIKKEAIPYLEGIIKNLIIQKNIVIPVTGWEEITEGEEGGVSIDLEEQIVTEEMIPFVSIVRSDMKTARDCGMDTTIETINGAVKFYAEKVPEKEINASLLLLRAGYESDIYINNIATDNIIKKYLLNIVYLESIFKNALKIMKNIKSILSNYCSLLKEQSKTSFF